MRSKLLLNHLKNKEKNIFYIVLMISLAISMTIVFFMGRGNYERRRQIAKANAEVEKARIRSTFSSYLFPSKVWELMIDRDNGEVEDFERITKDIENDYPAICAIELISQEHGRYIYKANALPVASDYLTNFEKSTDELTLSQPVTLTDHKQGLILKRKISFKGQNWGSALIVLDFDKLLSLWNLNNSIYNYDVTYDDKTSGKKTTIYRSIKSKLVTPVQTTIPITADIQWKIQVAPQSGWINFPQYLFNAFVAVLLAIMIALISVLFYGYKQSADHDHLTDLFNGRTFIRNIRWLSHRHKEYGIIYLDLNKFKAINDSYGHQAGNDVLFAFAIRLRESLRANDRCYRVGGDEFAVVINGQHGSSFYDRVIKRLRQNIEQPVMIEGKSIPLSISAGYASTDETTDYEKMIHIADKRMYKNKRSEV